MELHGGLDAPVNNRLQDFPYNLQQTDALETTTSFRKEDHGRPCTLGGEHPLSVAVLDKVHQNVPLSGVWALLSRCCGQPVLQMVGADLGRPRSLPSFQPADSIRNLRIGRDVIKYVKGCNQYRDWITRRGHMPIKIAILALLSLASDLRARVWGLGPQHGYTMPKGGPSPPSDTQRTAVTPPPPQRLRSDGSGLP